MDMAVENRDYDPDVGWTDDAFEANLRHVVRVLLAAADMEPDALADELGIGRSAIYARLPGRTAKTKPTKFSASEIRRMAEIFGQPVQVFFDPVEDLLRSRCFTLLAGHDVDSQLVLPLDRVLEPVPVPG